MSPQGLLKCPPNLSFHGRGGGAHLTKQVLPEAARVSGNSSFFSEKKRGQPDPVITPADGVVGGESGRSGPVLPGRTLPPSPPPLEWGSLSLSVGKVQPSSGSSRGSEKSGDLPVRSGWEGQRGDNLGTGTTPGAGKRPPYSALCW